MVVSLKKIPFLICTGNVLKAKSGPFFFFFLSVETEVKSKMLD